MCLFFSWFWKYINYKLDEFVQRYLFVNCFIVYVSFWKRQSICHYLWFHRTVYGVGSSMYMSSMCAEWSLIWMHNNMCELVTIMCHLSSIMPHKILIFVHWYFEQTLPSSINLKLMTWTLISQVTGSVRAYQAQILEKLLCTVFGLAILHAIISPTFCTQSLYFTFVFVDISCMNWWLPSYIMAIVLIPRIHLRNYYFIGLHCHLNFANLGMRTLINGGGIINSMFCHY